MRKPLVGVVGQPMMHVDRDHLAQR
jgi:hypothetical protein